jgi:predicted small metal-binding protein
MSKMISCDDGTVIRGENDAELLAGARRHMHDAHPELELSDEQLLGMAVDEAARA